MKEEKFKVLLYLKKSTPDKSGKTPIMGRITVGKSMPQFGCEISCTPDLWNPRESRLNGKNREAVASNAKLDKLLLFINEAYNTLLEQKQHFIEDKCDIIIAMLEELKSGNKNQKSQQMDFSKIESLSERLENCINATSDVTVKMEDILEEVRKPVIRERHISIDIVSKEVAFLLIGMGLVISVLGSALYFSPRPNYDRIDNDLKYRYIKMKGEATPERISELEDLFEVNRNYAKIRQMGKDVQDYE